MNKLYSCSLLILVFSSLWGCGSSSENEEVPQNVEPVEDRVLESNVLGNSELDSLILEGTWVSECLPNGNDSSIRQWIFNGSDMEFTKREFTGLECQDSFSRTKLEGHFELGEVLTLDDGQQVNKIRYMLDNIAVIYYSADVASQFNNVELCDLDSWQVGQSVDVTGCDAFRSVGEIGNDIFSINGEDLSAGDITAIASNAFPNHLLDYSYSFRESEMIEGEWVQECNPVTGNDYFTQTLAFTSSLYTRNTDYYRDSSCGDLFYSLKESGGVVIGDEQILTTGITVTNLDLSINSRKLAFHSVEDAELYSSFSLCEISDWVPEEYREVSSCEFFIIEGDIKDIFYIEEEKLFLGQGAVPGGFSYPTELNDAFFTR